MRNLGTRFASWEKSSEQIGQAVALIRVSVEKLIENRHATSGPWTVHKYSAKLNLLIFQSREFFNRNSDERYSLSDLF